MKVFDEGKVKIQNIDISMQCILMKVGYNPEFEDSAHYHEYIELLYGLDIESEVLINGKALPFQSGDLIIINSMELHRLRFFKEKNEYIVIKFSPQEIYSSEQSLFELKYMLPFTLNGFSSERRITADIIGETEIPVAVKTILNEWKSKSYGYELSMRTHILQILLWLLRYWNKNTPQFLTDISLPPILLKALPYINQNLATVTANDVADFCGYSYTYFSEMFKSSMRMRFRDYLLKTRISEAEKLLLTTDMEITNIALSIGFSTASHFIKQFKAVRGITPAQYRSKSKNILDITEVNL